MKYKILTLVSALALAAVLSGCGDRMMANGNVEPDIRPSATTMPRVTTMPNATNRPAATQRPDDGAENKGTNNKEKGGMLQEAENDLERTADKVEDELSDGDGIVR